MDISCFPEDLKIDGKSGVQLFDYHSNQDILKGKINLSKHTISFLQIGTKEVIGDNHSVRIEPDKFVLMKAGNCLMTETVSDTTSTYHSRLLFFDDEVVIDFMEKYRLDQELGKKDSFFVFDFDDYLHAFVRSLAAVGAQASPLRSKLLRSKFEELMLYLTHLEGSAFLRGLISKRPAPVQQLRTVVENNRLKRLNLSELAFLSNMSLSSFKREFQRQYQLTPSKWFQKERLRHAALLLKSGEQRPVDLFEESGYRDLSNFIQAFKKEYGVTPKQYQSQF